MVERPFSEACERNKDPILRHLRPLLTEPGELLEIGSGTGQHAVHFAAGLPHLIWHASDRPQHHAGIQAWMDWAALPNLKGPHALDVSDPDWPLAEVDAAYSANTAHIMHWWQVGAMFAGLGQRLRNGAPFCLYGPFSRGGRHNSESNARFDASLREQDSGMGIRDLNDLEDLGRAEGLMLKEEWRLPANNRLLLFRRIA
jgi:hypothetical protein